MHLELYVEEPSAKEALDLLMRRIVGAEHGFTIHAFRGKQHLLREIPDRLRGYARWLPPDWRIVVLVDEDRQDCHALKRQLLEAARAAGIEDRVLCRVAVEELEAWFLGDPVALRAAYPRLPRGIARRRRFRNPDAVVGGTWEALDRALRAAGYRQGLVKTQAAREIAMHMEPDRNRSRSFRAFVEGVRCLIAEHRR